MRIELNEEILGGIARGNPNRQILQRAYKNIVLIVTVVFSIQVQPYHMLYEDCRTE